MKKKRTIIYLFIVTTLFTLLGISTYYLNKLNAAEIYTSSVEHTYEVISNIEQLERSLIDAETGQRGFLLTRDSTFLEPYIKASKEIPDLFLKLDYLTSGDSRQQKRLDTLQTFINTRLLYLKNNNLSQQKNEFLAVQKTGKDFMDKIRKTISNIENHERKLLQARNIYKSKNTRDSKVTSFVALIFAFVFCCIACIVIMRFFNQNQKHLLLLQKTNYELAAQNADFEALIIASTHNLQEPMRKIQLFIDRYLTRTTDLDELTKQDFERLRKTFNHQQNVNNSIIDYFSAIKHKEVLVKLKVHDALHEILTVNNWQHVVSINISKELTILSERNQLQSLIENIISNSVIFNENNSELKITITQLKEFVIPQHLINSGITEFIAISISDNGIGIDKAYHKKIFELFQKIESVNIAQKGMGLSFSKRIMLHHKGWIEATNNSPKGVNIILYFPKIK